MAPPAMASPRPLHAPPPNGAPRGPSYGAGPVALGAGAAPDAPDAPAAAAPSASTNASASKGFDPGPVTPGRDDNDAENNALSAADADADAGGGGA
jgi:hypothetical protein